MQDPKDILNKQKVLLMSYILVLHTAIFTSKITFIYARTKHILICFDRPKPSDSNWCDCNWYDSEVSQLIFHIDTMQ